MAPRRFDRALPWALAALFAAPWLLGLTWDASFEAAPSNSALVSEGDDRIRELKVEVRSRLEDEHCIGNAGTGCSGGGGDNGYHREGSAHAYYRTAAPTTVFNAALPALGSGDVGRLWVDSDGADGVAGNNDDYRLSVWDGTSAWKTQRWESMSGIVLTGIATGDILKYNGTNLVNTPVATLITRAQATFDIGESFIDGVCTADCTGVGGAVLDHNGGGDTNGYPEVTVPSTPAGVVWDIYVYGKLFYEMTTANAGNPSCAIKRDVNDADSFPTLQDVYYTEGITNANGSDRICVFNSVLTNATAGASYAFRIEMIDGGALTADWDISSSAAPAPVASTSSQLTVEVRPRTAF